MYCREAVDTEVDLGDQVGLYTHCVTVELGDGRIVHQGPYPGHTHCAPTFLDAWEQLLNAQWNQVLQISVVWCRRRSERILQFLVFFVDETSVTIKCYTMNDVDDIVFGRPSS